MGTQPLTGFRALELGYSGASVCGRYLSDLGVEVVKVEDPSGADRSLHAPRHRDTEGYRLSHFWLAYNVGKRSISLDVRTALGREILDYLFPAFDIVLVDHTWAHDGRTADQLFERASAANPTLIWGEIWPYGRGEVADQLLGTELTAQAAGGHMYLNGDADRPPVAVGLPVATLQAGVELAGAVTAALYGRLRDGIGDRISVSMQECVVGTLLNTTMTWQLLQHEEMRGGEVRRERSNSYFTRIVWPCADGYVHMSPVGGGGGEVRRRSYTALVDWMVEDGHDHEILHRPEWNSTENVSDIPQDEYDAVVDVIRRFLMTKTSAEIMKRAVDHFMLAAAVSSVPQVLENEHLNARSYFTRVEGIVGDRSALLPGQFARFSETPLKPITHPPRLGEATEELLAMAGYTSEQVAQFSSTGVI
ncbi:CoA transferase [Nocardioides sp.]|uniref:CoA transferase n=1 Tax=Nocardioides sp. TaxID=35761 RepID=UPI003D1193B8